MNQRVALGKPAEAGEKILGRRFRLTKRFSNIVQNGGRLLDLGCGNGALTELFAPAFDEVVGVDIQPSLLKQTRIDARWVTAAGEELPFPDNYFDAVVSYEVIEHVVSPVRTILEIHRVLKPGGQAVISVPHKWWIFETHGAHLPLLPWNRVPFFSWLPESIHSRWAKARIYSRTKLERTLRNGGFERISIHHITAPMDRAKPRAVREFLQRTVFGFDTTPLPFAAVSLLAVVTKD
ncbi:class I SAM-dependent methyltransferase [bacterium]|nr:class I SAM-dependent methyltransferase [bacterium]